VNYYTETNRGPISITISKDEILKLKNHNCIIYTCNTNNYSPVDHFKNSLEICEKNKYGFYIFTDRYIKNVCESNQIIFSYDAPNPRFAAKIFKILPYQFINSNISLWVDSNIILNNNITKLINRFISTPKGVMLFNHNKRSSIDEEAKECIRFGKDDEIIIKTQISNYIKEKNSLERFGLFQGGIILSKKKKVIIDLFESWWAEIQKGSIRDQLSLPIVLFQYKSELMTMNNGDLDKYFSIINHNKYEMYGVDNSFSGLLKFYKSKILNYLSSRL